MPAEPFSPLSPRPRGARTARACPCHQGTLSPTDLALREESGAQPKWEESPPTPGPPLSQGMGRLFQATRTPTCVVQLAGAWARGCRSGACGVGCVGGRPCVSTL